MTSAFFWRSSRAFALACLVLTAGSWAALAQNTPEQQATMLLAGARRAYNDKNFPFAATQFTQFLQKFGNHKDANAARYGLALSLVEGEQRSYDKALEQLNQLANVKDFEDRPHVLYYSGLARRGQGVTSLSQAQAKPAEAAQHKANARARFEEAAKSFGDAAKAFAERAKDAPSDKGLPIDHEWTVRSHCDQAEMLLRVGKAKEAKEAVAPALDKKYDKSRFANLGLYYHGFASFQLGDLTAAGKSLARTGVTNDEVFGTHARYLLGRVHHQSELNEREEARTQYQAAMKDHDAAKKTAQTELQQKAAQLRNDPERRGRLERLVKGPVPDHVARATFFLGVLQYEDGRFGEARQHFEQFVKDYPASSLATEARLRQGFCLVQLKQAKDYDEAVKILTPIAEKEPALADQALLWIAKAQAGKADPAKPDSYKAAIDTFRRAANKAGERANGEPAAKVRRGEALAEQAETEIAARQYKEAINTYRGLLQEKLLPGREDEMTLHLATACQLAGDYADSDRACAAFIDKHKESTLLPSVLFRRAENAAFMALAAEKNQNPQERAKDVAKHNDEAIKRYGEVIEKYPEHANVHLARQGLGMAHYRKGDLPAAQKALEAIPAADRSGELAVVAYQIADVYLRQAPARADDAVAAGKLEEKLKGAADALEGFVGAAPESPQVPDALLKLGLCQQRMAKLLAMPADQQKMLAAARATYERIQQKHPKDEAFPQATFERAKVIASQKDVGNAMNELKRFSADPLKKSPVAPMALLHLATLQRSQNQPAAAAATLAECRKDHEDALGRDAARSGWVLQLRYHHAVALREAGKYEEARALFDTVARGNADRPEAWDAGLRAGQSQKEGGEKAIAEASRKLADVNLKGDKRAAEEKNLADGMNDVRAAAQYLAAQEQALKARKVTDEEDQRTLSRTRARMLYEAAWAWRSIAAMEQEAARDRMREERWKLRRDEVARATPKGQNPPQVARPEVDVREVPVQPGETEARKQYRAVIATFPEAAINADARFELAELLGQRADHDEAVKLLQGALEAEREPTAELADRIKVRLSASLLDRGVRRQVDGQKKLAEPKLEAKAKEAAAKLVAEGKKDVESALETVQTVTANEKSAMLTHATYREAECLLHQGKTDEAIKLLSKFRDVGPFQNVPGLTDRALLRLGNALGEKKQWEPSRQAYERLVNSFGNSPWVHEGRYGMAWARQNQGQYDEAVNLYGQVTNALSTELAARAQLNVGLCRLAQKRYAEAGSALLVVPYTYDYPELGALALMEAARAFSEDKQTNQAVRLLRRVVQDHAGTAHAEAAKKRLTDLGEDS